MGLEVLSVKLLVTTPAVSFCIAELLLVAGGLPRFAALALDLVLILWFLVAELFAEPSMAPFAACSRSGLPGAVPMGTCDSAGELGLVSSPPSGTLRVSAADAGFLLLAASWNSILARIIASSRSCLSSWASRSRSLFVRSFTSWRRASS